MSLINDLILLAVQTMATSRRSGELQQTTSTPYSLPAQTASETAPGRYGYRQEQAHQPSFWNLPLPAAASGLVSALFAGGAYLSVVLVSDSRAWPPAGCFVAAFVAGGLIFLIVLFRLMETNQRTEEVGVELPPAPEPEPTRVQGSVLDVTVPKADGAGWQRQLIKAPSLAAFSGWARAALLNRSLAVKNWSGAAAPFSEAEYQVMMAQLEEIGVVRNAGGNRGRQLTDHGRRVLTHILEQPDLYEFRIEAD
ncbi:MAG: hypothetical protein Kow0031_02710 [Anaerolineae bacterium]